MATLLLPQVDDAPRVALRALDQLWFQVSGTLCNLTCRHCFNESGPHSDSFGMLGYRDFEEALAQGVGMGARECYFTGGEPFLNRELPRMTARALEVGPVTILTNATVLPDHAVRDLVRAEAASRYSLELRVSLDGETAERNDPIRGEGTFERILAGLVKLSEAGFLPILTVTQTWSDDRTLEVLRDLGDLLRSRGCRRPRIKVLPALKIGREAERTRGYDASEVVTREMLGCYDRDNLLCSQARIVTDRGVWVCPILVLAPDARLGDDLREAAAAEYPLAHRACHTCWTYGAICSNFPSPGDAG